MTSLKKLRNKPRVGSYINIINNYNLSSEEIKGTICGINIKPIFPTKSKMVDSDNFVECDIKYTKKWGLFVHIRLENNDQYDAVWKIEDTFSLNSEYGVPEKKDGKKKRKQHITHPTIPTLFNIIGVDEWVDVIGTEVIIIPINGIIPAHDGFAIVGTDDVHERYKLDTDSIMFPDYFWIHEGGVQHE